MQTNLKQLPKAAGMDEPVRSELERDPSELGTCRKRLGELERSEVELQKSGERYRRIFDAVPGMICTLNAAGEVELLNRQVLEYFGKTPEELKNWTMLDVVHPDDLGRVIETWKHSVETGEPYESEQRQRRADGVFRWHQSRALPARDEEGRITGWYMLITDVDDRKKAEEALRSSEQFTRGQAEASRRILDALAHESFPDRMIEHVLRTITEHFRAHSGSVWRRDEASGRIRFEFAFEDGCVIPKTDARFAGMDLWLPMEESRPWTEVFRTGNASVVEDIRSERPFPLRDRLLPLGVVTVLFVPMFVSGQLEGTIGIRFTQKRSFRTEEIELAQALANQAMLALQLDRISAQSRQTAVLAERNRMARDIHDTLAQGFTGVIIQLEAAADATSQDLAKEAKGHLRRAGDLARESLREARRSVRALRPQALEQADLCEALDRLIRKMTAGTALRTQFNVIGTPRSLLANSEENMLRICQEVLTNVLRHAHAGKFTARLVFAARNIRLELRDDGCGFNASARHDGFGLLGIRERVEAMGGKFILKSAPDEGTMHLIILPPASTP